MNIGKRLKEIRVQKGITQAKLAELVGVSQQSIQKIEKGYSKSTSLIWPLSKALDVSPEWLQFGTANAEHLQNSHALTKMGAFLLKPTGKLPVLTWEEVLKFFSGGRRFNMDVIKDNPNRKYEVVYEAYPPNAFVLPIEGDSMMSPVPGHSFKEGMLIFIDPDRHPISSNYVICLLDNKKQAAFRQYVIDSGVVYLKPLNPQYPLQKMDENTRIIGVVIEYKGKLI